MMPSPLRIRVLATQSLRNQSDLLIDQIRPIDNRRLLGVPLARLDDELMRRVAQALREVLESTKQGPLGTVEAHAHLR